MTPELANNFWRVYRDYHALRFATEADCPHCGKPMKKGQRTDGTQTWFWFCDVAACIEACNGRWRANCEETKEAKHGNK